MAARPVYSRDDVIDAGLAVVARDGLAGLSARRVADELGASTAPVYSNFANMDELGVAVRKAVADRILAYTNRPASGDEFLDIGIGVLEYARDHPGLYSAVFLRPGGDCEAGPHLMAHLSARMARLAGLRELPTAERALLLQQMAVFTHGLAVQLCTGLAPDLTFADLVLLLEDAGAAMIRHAHSWPQRSAAQSALIARLITLNTKEEHGQP